MTIAPLTVVKADPLISMVGEVILMDAGVISMELPPHTIFTEAVPVIYTSFADTLNLPAGASIVMLPSVALSASLP